MKQQDAPSTEKQQAILKAAIHLFLKYGYSETSMDAVAARARVTKQTVYSYYQSKDSLFVQMISFLCRKHTPSDYILQDAQKPFEVLLYEAGLAFLDLVTSPEVLAATRLVIAESERHPKLAQLYYESGTQRLMSDFAHFLDQQNKCGVVHIPNTTSAASYFMNMLKGQYYLRMILRVKPLPSVEAMRAHVKETVRIFMKLYASDKPLVTQSTL